MKEYSILNLQNYNDAGGQYELIKSKSTITFRNEVYTYISTGLVRDVFISPDGKWVLKVPKKFDTWGFEHNRLEVECYNEAPEWCKNHIAESYLTEDGYCVQEYLTINPDCGNYFRELGFRTDGTCVIFDCDIFLNYDFKKPKTGFKYQQVFAASKIFKDAWIEATELPKRERIKQKETRKLYFPNLENQKYRGQGTTVWIDDVEISPQIALECGFITELNED